MRNVEVEMSQLFYPLHSLRKSARLIITSLAIIVYRLGLIWLRTGYACAVKALWINVIMSASFSESIPCSSGVEVRQPSEGQYAGSSVVESDAVVDVGSAVTSVSVSIAAVVGGTGVSIGSACTLPHPVITSTTIDKPIVFRIR